MWWRMRGPGEGWGGRELRMRFKRAAWSDEFDENALSFSFPSLSSFNFSSDSFFFFFFTNTWLLGSGIPKGTNTSNFFTHLVRRKVKGKKIKKERHMEGRSLKYGRKTITSIVKGFFSYFFKCFYCTNKICFLGPEGSRFLSHWYWVPKKKAQWLSMKIKVALGSRVNLLFQLHLLSQPCPLFIY